MDESYKNKPRKQQCRRQPREADGTFTYCTELDARQQEMINELIKNGGHKSEACKKLNIARSVLYRWFDNELFMKAYRQACERLYQDGLSKAVRTVLKLTDSKDSRTALKAAETILKLNEYLGTGENIQEKPTEIHITLEDNRE